MALTFSLILFLMEIEKVFYLVPSMFPRAFFIILIAGQKLLGSLNRSHHKAYY